MIDHPTKVNKKLVYSCLEGPENSVYVRGRIQNETIIKLPEYWNKLVDSQSITVSLTPVGINQEVFVESFNNEKVVIKSNDGVIDCFYHIFAERVDIEKLQTEVDA